jgi:hypothetical protein
MVTGKLRDKTKKYNSLAKKTSSEMRFLVDGHKVVLAYSLVCICLFGVCV